MPRPDDRELFALYHLGLDTAGAHAFRNLADVARIYGTDRPTVTGWLKAAGIDPDTVGSVDFNLSKLHVDAMFVSADQVSTFIDEAWNGYRKARESAVAGTFVHDIDYDEL